MTDVPISDLYIIEAICSLWRKIIIPISARISVSNTALRTSRLLQGDIGRSITCPSIIILLELPDVDALLTQPVNLVSGKATKIGNQEVRHKE